MKKIVPVPIDETLVERLTVISERAEIDIAELISDAVTRHLADLENYYLTIHELRSVRLDHPEHPLASTEVCEYLDLNSTRPNISQLSA